MQTLGKNSLFTCIRENILKLILNFSCHPTGINEFHFNDGRHLPHNHGFEYVGTILPFSLETVCDQTGVPFKLSVHHNIPPTFFFCFCFVLSFILSFFLPIECADVKQIFYQVPSFRI